MAEANLPDILMDVPEVAATTKALSSELPSKDKCCNDGDDASFMSCDSDSLDEGEARWDALGRMNSIRRSNRFTKPKTICVHLKRESACGFGLELTGHSPPTIASLSSKISSNVHVGDQLLEVNDHSVRGLTHCQAGQLIAQVVGDSVKLLLNTVKSSSSSKPHGEVIYCGWLMKRGGSGIKLKNWRRRWFVLRDDCIAYYYSSPAESSTLGAIVLNRYTVSKASHDIKKPHTIQLVKGGGRTYYLSAENEEKMDKWAQVLTEAASLDRKVENFSEPAHNVAISALSIKNPDCTGFLHKRGGAIRTWKRRYCVLIGWQVFYYPSMTHTTACGVMNLRGYTIERGIVSKSGKHFFTAVAPCLKMRSYYFYVDSDGERERWLKAFQGETTQI